MTILTVGKDLGKTKSFTLVGFILLGKIIILVSTLSSMKTIGLLETAVIVDLIGQIILTITTGLMVCGKYLDKDLRGAPIFIVRYIVNYRCLSILRRTLFSCFSLRKR